MIGNKILFRWYDSPTGYTRPIPEKEGIVVDAWTEVTGSGKGEVFIGFGDAKGEVKSRRYYKVEFKRWEYSDPDGFDYINILESSMIKILQKATEVTINTHEFR